MNTLGYVWLVGAGCPSRDMITLRGKRALEQADDVVYDALLDPGILEFACPDAHLHPMGKRQGHSSPAQQEINQLLVRLARQGRRVCRLKGGDPFVFGRGGEEALALREAGIPFSVVPGVTSAVAIPELAGIPVTHRRLSRSFHVITAHTADGEDLPAKLDQLAGLEGTLVFLMGLSRLPRLAAGLMEAGMPAQTPAAVVGASAVRGTLGDIAQKAQGMSPPAVILVGGSATLDLRSSGGPLAGARVGLTGTPSFQGKLRDELEFLGASVRSVQTSFPEPLCTPQELIDALEGCRWLALTSPNGARCLLDLLAQGRRDLRTLAGLRIAAVGSGTSAVLAQHGLFADLVPSPQTTAALGDALVQQGEGPVLLAGAENASHSPEQALEQAGIAYRRLHLYRTVAGPVSHDPMDYLLLGSAAGAERYATAGGPPPLRAAICVGPVTGTRARALGLGPVLEAETPEPAAMLRTMLNDWRT